MIHFVQKYCFDDTFFMKRKKNKRTKIACLNVFFANVVDWGFEEHNNVRNRVILERYGHH